MPASLRVALAGNPNCGKTALFNALTGSQQKVGNWPGVTVEKKTGICRLTATHEAEVVDLPGIYALSSTEDGALDERIACQYLLDEPTDVILNVVDGCHLERHLYFTLQLLETGKPVVLAVNMMDLVEKQGLQLDLVALSQALGCLVVPIIASQRRGLEDLKRSLQVAGTNCGQKPVALPLPEAVQNLRVRMQQQWPQQSQWSLARMLEKDQLALAQLSLSDRERLDTWVLETEAELEEELDIVIASARYSWLHEGVGQWCQKAEQRKKRSLSDRIDRLVLHPVAGIPIFLFVMYLMFLFAINVGGAFQDFFDISSSALFVEGPAHWLLIWHVPVWLTAILTSGIGKGINTTVTFIPVIGGMFLFLSFLEDCGYMARAAFVMDRLMRAMGLPGRAFVPMIVGFGCNVPAVMGARTLANRRDRVLTVMMMPFMSCGARLAIFAVFASAFFPQGGQNVIFLLYLTGILVAVLTGFMLRKTILVGKPAPMVMELPPYHLPVWGSIFRHAWQRLSHFLRRASRMIIPICLLIGALNAVTVTGHLSQGDANRASVLSAVGKTVTPVLAPMGIQTDNWPATVGLVTGVLAKEVVVGTLNTLYSQAGGLDEANAETFSLTAALQAAVRSIPENLAGLKEAMLNPILADEAPHDMDQAVYGIMYHRFGGALPAFCYLLFVLLYFPCVSTLAVMKREVGNRWAYFSVTWSLLTAYSAAVIVYQLATWAQHPLAATIWTVVLSSLVIAVVLWLRRWAGQAEGGQYASAN
jgi:ferrous iron transport protein B